MSSAQATPFASTRLGAGPFPGATGIPTKSPAKDGVELGNETVQRLHLKP
jgi:hypothetical protein